MPQCRKKTSALITKVKTVSDELSELLNYLNCYHSKRKTRKFEIKHSLVVNYMTRYV